MSAVQKDHEVNENWAIVGSVIWNLYELCIVILFIVHAFKTYQDLYTKERKSVAHRRIKPKITRSYKFTNIATCISIFHALASLSAAISTWAYTEHWECDIGLTLALVNIQLQKSWMYLVFLVRLFSIYEQSAYSYSKKCIGCVIISVVVFSVCAVIGIILVTESPVFTYGHDNYPNWCAPAGDLFIMMGGIIFTQDIVVAVGFIWAFLSPLRKTLKGIEKMHKKDPKITNKIVYAGTKTTLLTALSTTSTLVFSGLTVITSIAVFSGMDNVFTPICMMLMTPYYRDEIYYKRLCRLCLCCCDKTGRSVKDKSKEIIPEPTDKSIDMTVTNVTATNDTVATSTGTTLTVTTASDAKSIDTMSQLRVVNEKLNPTDNYKELDDNNGLQVTPEPQDSDVDDEQP